MLTLCSVYHSVTRIGTAAPEANIIALSSTECKPNRIAIVEITSSNVAVSGVLTMTSANDCGIVDY